MARPPQDSNRKEKLLEIALVLLRTHGLSGLSFQKMADRAKVSQSTVMHYFPSKNHLMSEVSVYVAQKNRLYVESFEKITDGAEQRLKNFILKNFLWAEKHPEYAQAIVLMSFLAISDHEFQKVYRVRLNSVREKILALLFAGQREKAFHFKAKDAPQIAALIHNFVVGGITNFLASGDAGEKANFHIKAELLVQALLKGNEN